MALSSHTDYCPVGWLVCGRTSPACYGVRMRGTPGTKDKFWRGGADGRARASAPVRRHGGSET
eukprot:2307977-Prymnesium_polylepis.1